MKKAVVSARCTGQDECGEDKVQNKCLYHWLKLHVQDFSTGNADSKGSLK